MTSERILFLARNAAQASMRSFQLEDKKGRLAKIERKAWADLLTALLRRKPTKSEVDSVVL